MHPNQDQDHVKTVFVKFGYRRAVPAETRSEIRLHRSRTTYERSEPHEFAADETPEQSECHQNQYGDSKPFKQIQEFELVSDPERAEAHDQWKPRVNRYQTSMEGLGPVRPFMGSGFFQKIHKILGDAGGASLSEAFPVFQRRQKTVSFNASVRE